MSYKPERRRPCEGVAGLYVDEAPLEQIYSPRGLKIINIERLSRTCWQYNDLRLFSHAHDAKCRNVGWTICVGCKLSACPARPTSTGSAHTLFKGMPRMPSIAAISFYFDCLLLDTRVEALARPFRSGRHYWMLYAVVVLYVAPQPTGFPCFVSQREEQVD